MLLHVSRFLRAFVLQDLQEMEWTRGMQDVFLFIFLAGMGVWVVAEFYRTFWKPNEDVVAEKEVNI